MASLLDASIGVLERTEGYESEAQRLQKVVSERDKYSLQPLPSLPSSPAPPIPPPRSTRPSAPPVPRPRTPAPSMEAKTEAAAVNPRPQLAIETAGGREELMEMYEARHRNWHRRGTVHSSSLRDSPLVSPSPLQHSFSLPAELRERQSVQGMLEQRAKAVRGAFLHLLQRLYRARFETRYDEKKHSRGDAASERQFAEVQKREEEAFRREAKEAKRRAIDPTIRYRDFMQWLKEESERMEGEIECEVERREIRRWERKMKTGGVDQSLLDSSRLSEADKLLDERARKALRARQTAHKHMEKREQVRRLESEARRAVGDGGDSSSARSSIDDASFLLQQSMRRYSMGNEPLRVSSARGATAETSINANRDGRSLDESKSADRKEGGEKRKELMSEMKERLEVKRRQAEEVRRAMEESERRMTETEMVSVAAQLAAHDEYIREVEGVGRVIAQNVQPRSPSGLPPGVEPLDLSSLDEEGEGEEKKSKDSIEKSTPISGKESTLSRDSLDGIPSVPSSIDRSSDPSTTSASKTTSSSSSISTSSSNKTLKATEELSQLLEEIAVEEEKEDTVVAPQFSPLSSGRKDELDLSLPSTAASTGRQELTLDTVPLPDTVPPLEKDVEETPIPVETPQVPPQPMEESIPEERVERSTVPSRALFSPIESSTSRSEETESSSDRGGKIVTGGGRSTVVTRKESIEESSDEIEDETLDVSTTSLKKAISVASEMANPFDGFESSSGGSRKSEEKKEEEMFAPAVTATPTVTASSLDQSTVIEKSPIVQKEKEDDEISWGDGGGLELGGGKCEECRLQLGYGRR
ncbi:hypothetical protein PMAYCL1PPCAC_02443 [Pristionchus mayeri]|uniref:Uncharacterized protein n=1 Tax=Pristionchus mayeri TaxID=1317129 RepID=A0AAN4Z5D2_9BILA|nr:hypothetical protein PMAYCL1PPCAC_02443 [Pristionchus mayeri]